MFENAYFGIIALIRDTQLELTTIIHNRFFIGFFIGFIIATLLAAIIISENPRHIPIMLMYDHCKSFERLHDMTDTHTYADSYCSYVKKYHTVRTSFLIVLSLFSLSILAIIIFASF